MSNAAGDIDDIVSQQGLNNLDQAIVKADALYVSFKNDVAAIAMMNDALSKSSGIKEITKAIENINTATVKMTVTQSKSAVEYQKLQQQQEKTAQQLLKTEKEKLSLAKVIEAQDAKKKKALEEQTSLYQKLNREHLAAAKIAQEAGAKFGVSSEQYKKAANYANGLGKELIAIRQGLGNFKDDVGNYSGGIMKSFSGIWSVIRQAAAILPGLGISGILLAGANAAEYLHDKLTGANDELKKAAEIRKQMAETMNRSLESGGKEIVNLQSLYQRATDVNLAYAERLKAVKELQDQYPHYFGNLDKEIIMAGKAKDAYLDLNDQLVKSVIYRGFQSMADEMSKDLPKLLLMQDIISKKLAESYGKKQAPDDYSTEGTIRDQARRKALLDSLRAIPGIGEELTNTMEREGLTLQQMLTKITGMVDESQVKIKNVLAAAQEYSSTLIGGKDSKDPKGKATPTPKEVNRIDDIKKQYDMEASLLATARNQGLITEENYYSGMISLSQKYYDERSGLSKHEKESEVKFNEELSKSEKENHDNILKWLDEETKKSATADYAQLESSLKRIEEIRKANEKAYQETLDYIQGQMDAQQRMFDEQDKLDKKAFDKKVQYLNDTNQLVQNSTAALSSIGDIMYMRDIEHIDAKNKALKEYYDTELQAIEDSGLATKEKAEAKKKLDAEVAAQQKQLDRDRISAMRKQASIQKGLDIANLIGSTTVAVMSALGMKPYTPLNIAMAAGIAAKGAGELAKLIATPLPQYAEGRLGGPAEWAIVSEEGQEARRSKDGHITLLPATKSKVFLNEGDSVIPANITKNLFAASDTTIGNLNPSSDDRLQYALLDEFEEVTTELRGLRYDLRKKELTSNYYNLAGFDMYKLANRM